MDGMTDILPSSLHVHKNPLVLPVHRVTLFPDIIQWTLVIDVVSLWGKHQYVQTIHESNVKGFGNQYNIEISEFVMTKETNVLLSYPQW